MEERDWIDYFMGGTMIVLALLLAAVIAYGVATMDAQRQCTALGYPDYRIVLSTDMHLTQYCVRFEQGTQVIRVLSGLVK